jgi:hypothetical protein
VVFNAIEIHIADLLVITTFSLGGGEVFSENHTASNFRDLP